MDLILLQPGDQRIFGDEAGAPDNSWRNDGPSGRCIELVSLHQGMKQQITTDATDNVRTSGRPVITEFTLVKYVDSISVKLYDHCLRARPLDNGGDAPTMIYLCRNSGDQTTTLITIALKNALISEIQLQSHPDDMPTEQFKLNFTEISWTYHAPQANDGSPASSVTTGWNLAANAPTTDKLLPKG